MVWYDGSRTCLHGRRNIIMNIIYGRSPGFMNYDAIKKAAEGYKADMA